METIISRGNILKDTNTVWYFNEKLWFGDLLFQVPSKGSGQPSQLQLDCANQFVALSNTDEFRARIDFWIQKFVTNLTDEDFPGGSEGDYEEFLDLLKVRLPDIRKRYKFSEMLIPREGCSSEAYYVCGIFQGAGECEILLRVTTASVQLVSISKYWGLCLNACHWCTLDVEDLQKWLDMALMYHPPDSTWMIPSTN